MEEREAKTDSEICTMIQLIRYRDIDGSIKQVQAREIFISSKFDSIVINFETNSTTPRKYFLRRTKRDRLVLT